jgi:hypothetical protein
MFIRWRGLWLVSAHRAASSNRATVAEIRATALAKSGKSTPKPTCGFRRLDAAHGLRPETILYDIVEWRTMVDEDGQYCFAVAV